MFQNRFIGDLLFVDINECASSPCKNGGTCIDLTADWTSSSSGFNVGYSCQCMAGYAGNQCETSEFFLVILVSFHRCCYQMSTNVSLCLASTEERALIEWTTTFAIAHLALQATTAKRVSANFYDVVLICLCLINLVDIDECESIPCQNGGNCTDGIARYTCDCIPGHTGENCETSGLLG